MTYTTINVLAYIIKLVSFKRIIPVDEDLKEYWTCRLSLAQTPPSLSNCSVRFQINHGMALLPGSCGPPRAIEGSGMLSLIKSQARLLPIGKMIPRWYISTRSLERA